MCSKVDQDTQFKAACVKVIDYLGGVLVDQLPHGFDLDDDLLITTVRLTPECFLLT
jgi:hypothetical protein